MVEGKDALLPVPEGARGVTPKLKRLFRQKPAPEKPMRIDFTSDFERTRIPWTAPFPLPVEATVSIQHAPMVYTARERAVLRAYRAQHRLRGRDRRVLENLRRRGLAS